jgi:hypothetical protein
MFMVEVVAVVVASLSLSCVVILSLSLHAHDGVTMSQDCCDSTPFLFFYDDFTPSNKKRRISKGCAHSCVTVTTEQLVRVDRLLEGATIGPEQQ